MQDLGGERPAGGCATSEGVAANARAKFARGAWGPSYFVRLKAFVVEAGRRDIVAGFNLFGSMYCNIRPGLSAKSDTLWGARSACTDRAPRRR